MASKADREYLYARMNELGIKFPSTIHSLISLPAGDGNYKRPLEEATREELLTAIAWFDEFPNNNSSRRKAVEKKLKSMKDTGTSFKEDCTNHQLSFF